MALLMVISISINMIWVLYRFRKTTVVEAIALYPNPATGNSQLVINSDNATTVTVDVTDLNGRLVSSFR